MVSRLETDRELMLVESETITSYSNQILTHSCDFSSKPVNQRQRKHSGALDFEETQKADVISANIKLNKVLKSIYC